MKKLLSLLFFIAFSGMLFAQTYPLVTIEDIQYQHPDSLLQNGDQVSPLFGDTVRVQGVVMVRPVVDPGTDRRRVFAAGNRWMIYMVDPNGNQHEFFDGIIPIQHDTTGVNQNTFFDLVDTADVVEFTVVVEEFFTTTQGALLINPPTAVSIVGNLVTRPAPIEVDISEFVDAQGNWNPLSEKYEGMYVIVRNAISSDRDLGNGTFRLNDGQGNSILMYDQSGFFTLRAHRLTGITDYQPPVDGSNITFIRGFIQTHSDLGARIAPAYWPFDMEIGASSPAISNVRRDAAEIFSDQAVEITTSIIDFDGIVQEAKIFYTVDDGSPDSVAMMQDAVDTTKWSGTIPGITSDSSLVDYYIQAIDNEGRVSTNPSNINAPQFFYLVLNRNVTIQDVQYNPFGTDVSGYNHYYVTLTGTITADTSDFPGTGVTAFQIMMQNGEGPWSGIRIGTRGLLGDDLSALQKGDNVTINGYIWDDAVTPTFNVTRIDSVTSIVINSTGNTLPDYKDLETNVIGLGGLGEVEKEQWESVLIRYNTILVTDENADGDPLPNFGEMLVDDGTGDTRVELEDGNHSYHNLSDPLRTFYIMTGSTFEALSGVMYYSFGNYKLVPRNDDDFVGFTTDVTETEEIPTEYSLSQNYPNPFNPSTTIQYSLPEAGDVTLRVYNLLGQEVKTVFNNVSQSAGTHKVVLNISELPSGIYFYSFRVNDFVQVKKMILMK
ncbi:MAG: T9SS type A sorting domain-containing protein [Bacteroidetes bacterium]|nr:T9SS type A sorting domain-containing protein [Bacteroidota bacterium]